MLLMQSKQQGDNLLIASLYVSLHQAVKQILGKCHLGALLEPTRRIVGTD